MGKCFIREIRVICDPKFFRVLNRAYGSISSGNYLSVAIPLRVIAIAGSSLESCRFQVYLVVCFFDRCHPVLLFFADFL
jgi:hypothetical protein